ncbi:MAG: type II toxin-antitoxin system RelE/ParE family toxin [Bacteroidota bacterium]
MRGYDLLAPARDDILDLVEYVGEYSEQARDRLTDTLVECFERVSDFPHLGRDRADLKEGLRSVALNRLRVDVFYYPIPHEEGDRVLIARVLRQERDVNAEDFS